LFNPTLANGSKNIAFICHSALQISSLLRYYDGWSVVGFAISTLRGGRLQVFLVSEMVKMQDKVSTLVERIFPERQIYHRSGGTVNYISVSPLQQSIIAIGGGAVALWCIFATAAFMLGSPGGVMNSDLAQENAKLERWFKEAAAKEELARLLLLERSEAFAEATDELEERHQRLKLVLDALAGSEELEISALRGNGAEMLIEASIDNSDPRQSREQIVEAAGIEVVGVRAKINRLEAEQTLFLNAAENLAVERAEKARGILKLTGVGVNRIVDTGNAVGGPLVDMLALSAGEASTPEERAFTERVIQVGARLEEARHFEGLVDSMPLAWPSSVPLRITSNYGFRADPFSRRSAWHAGIDMGAGAYGRRVPITASGPGTVAFAGRKSGYGRVVYIDHGNGFQSRYGHLASISVTKGDVVAIGDTLGIMGSSGRSTGRHLHFEVLFQNKAYEPSKFLKAGQYVH
jgi:murein DD-endopeptidase MepM/ murein hydrolase activator NlpD